MNLMSGWIWWLGGSLRVATGHPAGPISRKNSCRRHRDLILCPHFNLAFDVLNEGFPWIGSV